MTEAGGQLLEEVSLEKKEESGRLTRDWLKREELRETITGRIF